MHTLFNLNKAFFLARRRKRNTYRHRLTQREVISPPQDEDISSLLVGLRRLDLACELQARVRKATSCSILYHHTVILPTYLTHYLQTLEHVHRIHVSQAVWSPCHCMLVERSDTRSTSEYISQLIT